MNTAEHLKIEDLHTYFYSNVKRAFIHSVNGVSLTVNKGETLGIVGESGSGKSISMLSTMGLINAAPGVLQGEVTLHTKQGSESLLKGLDQFVKIDIQDKRIISVKKDLNAWNKQVENNMKHIRGKEISMIFQNPKAAMNPYETIGKQIVEMVLLHTELRNKHEAKEKAVYWLERVKIDSPQWRFDNHPFGLSGGMCQRAMVAMALSSEPSLLIADEPTTGLDATIQSKIIDLLAELQQELGITMVLISHDISVISRLSDNIAVMYSGTVMEQGPAKAVLDVNSDKTHPYTQALLSSVPEEHNLLANGHLKSIDGEVPDTIDIPAGCRFYARCKMKHSGIEKQCHHENPPFQEISPGHRVRCWLRIN
ncbi:MAG: ABC transporter ATP-binding protein [Gammaproteobacteria bacterium]|nr:ABC transporter ATP-binding protein [Gammaproteobacteria bacterium]MDH5730207.1 ABC transporter ATP-binding protein [Gammaproteobacteria bacterium]